MGSRVFQNINGKNHVELIIIQSSTPHIRLE
jgi:hypothetical protein